MNSKPTASILHHFSMIKDPRVNRQKKYELQDLFFITPLSRFVRLYAVRRAYRAVGQIMGCLLKCLVTLRNLGSPNCSVCNMGFPRTTPSVMYLQPLIAPNLVIVFPTRCRTWPNLTEGDVIAIDGKCLRRSTIAWF